MVKWPIFISNRLIKLVANLFKILYYPVHCVFPKMRFTIPVEARPWLKPRQQEIPNIIWQTNYTNHVTFPLYVNYLFNRLMAPRYIHRYVSHEARELFIQQNFSSNIYTTYMQLKDGAAQADLWRLLVLNNIGGVYMDIDAHLVWPLARLIKPNDKELYVEERKDHLSNFFIASVPNNPILSETTDIILENIRQRRTEKGVYYLTGPIALNEVVKDKKVNYLFRRYVCEQGNFTNEYYQYIDKPRGKWIHAKEEDLMH